VKEKFKKMTKIVYLCWF